MHTHRYIHKQNGMCLMNARTIDEYQPPQRYNEEKDYESNKGGINKNRMNSNMSREDAHGLFFFFFWGGGGGGVCLLFIQSLF